MERDKPPRGPGRYHYFDAQCAGRAEHCSQLVDVWQENGQLWARFLEPEAEDADVVLPCADMAGRFELVERNSAGYR